MKREDVLSQAAELGMKSIKPSHGSFQLTQGVVFSLFCVP